MEFEKIQNCVMMVMKTQAMAVTLNVLMKSDSFAFIDLAMQYVAINS